MKIKYVGTCAEHTSQRRRGRQRVHFDADDVKDNVSLFNLLNDKDRDILYLVFVSKKKQQSVRRILRRSQSMLVYDIKRIRERIQFIVYLRQVFDIFLNFIEEQSSAYDIETVEILIMMYYTSSFTQTAEVLGHPQIYVRYTFEKALKAMEENLHWDAYEIFQAIRHNKNRIRRIYRSRDSA